MQGPFPFLAWGHLIGFVIIAQTATPEIAQEAHHFCRKFTAKQWNKKIADSITILYGGSVKPDNAKSLISLPDIDGLLVGGASLSPESFDKIINYS